MLLVSFLDLATGWSSLEVQQRIETTFEQAGLADRFDVDTVLPLVRTASIIGAFLSMTVIVFSIFAARGDRGSRIALTVLSSLAFLVFVFGGISGLLPAILAILVLTLLWSKSSREWFAMVNSTEPLDLVTAAGPGAQSGAGGSDRRKDRVAGSVSPPANQPSAPAGSRAKPEQPQASSGGAPLLSPQDYFGGQQAPQDQPAAPPSSDQPAAPQSGWPQAPQQPAPYYGVAPAAPVASAPPATADGPMPMKLKISLAIAGTGALITAGISALMLMMLTFMRAELIAEIEKTPSILEDLEATGLSQDALFALMTGFSVAWLIAAILGLIAVAAVFTRKKFSWWLLVFVLAIPLVLSIVTFPLGLLTAIPVLASLVLLFGSDVRQSFM